MKGHQIPYITRMHSCRMRTGRLLTVCCSLLPVGCLLPGGRGVSARGVWSRGGGALLAGGVLPTGDPPVNRMTNRCKNITLTTTSLRPVIINVFALHDLGTNQQR